MRWSAVGVLLFTGALLVYGAGDLPPLGAARSAPAVHVSPRYIERAVEETGAENMVTAVIADYRAFDTLLESVVILVAGLSTALVLWPAHRGRS